MHQQGIICKISGDKNHGPVLIDANLQHEQYLALASSVNYQDLSVHDFVELWYFLEHNVQVLVHRAEQSGHVDRRMKE